MTNALLKVMELMQEVRRRKSDSRIKVVKKKTWFVRTPEYLYYKTFKKRTFTINHRQYPYFYHLYNYTWKNERCIEIPYILDKVRRFSPDHVLEVGNVLSHYCPVGHDIIDKYEEAPGIVNEDIATFIKNKKYNLIVSISTLEHVGWDEIRRDRKKISQTIDNLLRHLSPSGKLYITVPANYNPYLDNMIENHELPYSKLICLKRTSKDNAWMQTSYKEAGSIKYGSPYPYANALYLLQIDKN